MPDGDKFERRLYGKGWRRAYRLSGTSDSIDLIIDNLMSACSAALRDDLQDSSTFLQTMRKSIFEGLGIEAKAKATGLPLYKDLAYLQLSRNLDSLSDTGKLDLVYGLKTTAESVFLEFRESCNEVSREQVIDRIAEATVEKIIDTRFLSRIRDGIMETRKHSIEEQEAWEQNLKEKLAKPAREMLVNIIRSEKQISVRAPKKLTPRMRMDLNALNQELKVLIASDRS